MSKRDTCRQWHVNGVPLVVNEEFSLIYSRNFGRCYWEKRTLANVDGVVFVVCVVFEVKRRVFVCKRRLFAKLLSKFWKMFFKMSFFNLYS